MTDRELLQHAASAAGYVILRWERYAGVDVAFVEGLGYWQPLHKNAMTDFMGDALRLAVKLSIVVDPYTNFTMGNQMKIQANITDAYARPDGEENGFTEKHEGNPDAATALAIVRAATSLANKT